MSIGGIFDEIRGFVLIVCFRIAERLPQTRRGDSRIARPKAQITQKGEHPLVCSPQVVLYQNAITILAARARIAEIMVVAVSFSRRTILMTVENTIVPPVMSGY